MNGKKKYFPNKWARIKAIPADKFDSCTFEDFMEWKIAGWMLPENVECIIRAVNINNGKVKEHAYKRMSYANEKIKRYVFARTHELTICYDDSLCYIHPKDLEGYEFEEDD